MNKQPQRSVAKALPSVRGSRIRSVFFFAFAYGALVLASSAYRQASLADLPAKQQISTPLAVERPESAPLPQAFPPAQPLAEPTRMTPRAAFDIYEQARGFEENKGQLYDQEGAPNLAVKYLLRQPGLNVQLRATGFSYDTYVAEKPEENPESPRKGPGARKKKGGPGIAS